MKIKDFPTFINEAISLQKVLGGILTGEIKVPGEEGDETPDIESGDLVKSDDLGYVSGDDEFILYLQHQQGVSGMTGILKALFGKGKMDPDTLATKGSVKYANLMNNIPKDSPKEKVIISKYLDSGDQKEAAKVFLRLWKRKYESVKKNSKSMIKNPKYSRAVTAIKEACKKHNFPLDFAINVAIIESGLNPNAGNNKYKGLFALNPASNYDGILNKPLGEKWSDPLKNAESGVILLKSNIKKLKEKLGYNLWANLDLDPAYGKA